MRRKTIKLKGVLRNMLQKKMKRISYLSVVLIISFLFLSSAITVSADKDNEDTEEQRTEPNLTFDVISDTQLINGIEYRNDKMSQAMQDLHEVNPDTNAMVVDGDLIDDGLDASYDTFSDVFDNNPSPDNTFFAIGNHEFTGNSGTEAGFKDAMDRFIDFNNDTASTEIDEVYYKREVNGYPFIFLGSEGWGPSGSNKQDSARLSDEQIEWFENALDEYEEQDPDKPIFVFLHQPMQNSLLNTDNDNLPHYQESILNTDAENIEDEMKSIFKDHPQIIFFTAHMHYDLQLPKMFVEQDNITYVHTGGIFNNWGPDGSGGESAEPEPNTGLYVEVYDDRVDINGRDFANQEWIEEYQHSVRNSDDQIGELKLEADPFIQGEPSEITGTFTNISDKTEQNVELSLNALDDLSFDSTSETTFSEVEPGETVQVTWEATSETSGPRPLDGRADFDFDDEETSVITNTTIANHMAVAEVKSIVDTLREDNEIKDDITAHKLKMHLTAVEHFQEQAKTKKVVKHMKNFKHMIDYQTDEGHISEKASKQLKENTDSVIGE